MKVGDRVVDSKTGTELEIVAYEQPTRRSPEGRWKLDDGHWREGQGFGERYGRRERGDDPADVEGGVPEPSIGGLELEAPDTDVSGADGGGAAESIEPEPERASPGAAGGLLEEGD
jgi:hypothetical protein